MPSKAAQSFDAARAEYEAADRALDLLVGKLQGAVESGQFGEKTASLTIYVIDGLKNFRDAIYLQGFNGHQYAVSGDVVKARMGVEEGRDIPHGEEVQREIARRSQAYLKMRNAIPQMTPDEVAERAALMP